MVSLSTVAFRTTATTATAAGTAPTATKGRQLGLGHRIIDVAVALSAGEDNGLIFEIVALIAVKPTGVVLLIFVCLVIPMYVPTLVTVCLSM